MRASTVINVAIGAANAVLAVWFLIAGDLDKALACYLIAVLFAYVEALETALRKAQEAARAAVPARVPAAGARAARAHRVPRVRSLNHHHTTGGPTS